MALLGIPKGVFSLNESDKFVGSYISITDVAEILNVGIRELSNCLNKDLTAVNDILFIDEMTLRKKWKNGQINGAVPSMVGNATASLDEYIISAIIKKSFDKKAVVENQFKWGRKRIDLFVKLKEKEFFIEFLGPGHFTIQNNRVPENPLLRKALIEKEFNRPCYLWPYWIQRCKKNIQVLIEEARIGLGALWSTRVHFGDFIFDNSAQIIEEITSTFKASTEGYGVFYEQDSHGRNKPEHPILKKILNGKTKIEKLLPKGHNKNEVNFWLPRSLHKLDCDLKPNHALASTSSGREGY